MHKMTTQKLFHLLHINTRLAMKINWLCTMTKLAVCCKCNLWQYSLGQTLRLFTSIPDCDWVNLPVLFYLPLTQRGCLPLKVNVEIFLTGTTFEFWFKSHKTFKLWWLGLCTLNLTEIVSSLLRNLTIEFCDAVPFYSTGPWVSALNGWATSDLWPKE